MSTTDFLFLSYYSFLISLLSRILYKLVDISFLSKKAYFAYKTSETCFLCTFLNVNHNNLFSLHIPVFEECYVDGFPSVVWQSETGCKLVTNLLKTEWNISTFFSVRVFKNS